MLALIKSLLTCDLPSNLLTQHQDTFTYLFHSLNCCSKSVDVTMTSRQAGMKSLEGMSVLMGGAYPLPGPGNVIEYFENALLDKTRSQNASVYFDNRFMTYEELDHKASNLATCLYESSKPSLDLDADKDVVFAVDISPSFELLIAIVAVLKIGAAFLPVDSCSAINRVKKILQDCKPVCLIVDSNSAFLNDSSDELWSSYNIFDISKHTFSNVQFPKIPRVENKSVCTVLYTSGSTGLPKCVKITHKSLLNRLHFQWCKFPFGPNETCCFKTSILFIDSLVEIFSCLLNLVSLVIIPKSIVMDPEKLVPELEKYHISRLTFVPSLLRSLLMYLPQNGGSERLPDLKLWISNSEKLTVDMLKQFFHIYQGRIFANFYGSTETMADVTCEVYKNREDVDMRQRNGSLSIGRPFFNNNVYILDERGDVLPEGEVGEICVSGFNVSSTDSSLVYMTNDIVDDVDHRVIYCTGDYGRVISNMLIYEGRRDTQIKIRGQRVNITEIEEVVMECEVVKQVIVLCHNFSDISTLLVAYYVLQPGLSKSMVQSQIIDACRISLPPYMRPKLVNVKEMPLQVHTGKIDREKLRQLYERAFKRQSTRELITFDEKSQKVLNIIGMNLNIPPQAIPQKRSFSELGGNSISMISTIVQLKQYDLHIPIGSFSEASSIQDIINMVSESGTDIHEATPKGYKVLRLIDVPRPEETVQIMAESFIIKDPLEVLLGINKDEFLPFAKSLFEAAIKSELSIVVVDKASGKIVAGDFLFSLSKGCAVEHHQSMAPVLALLREFEQPIFKQLLLTQADEVMFNFCLFVHKDLDYPEQVKLCHLIEDNVIQVASRHGFTAIVTNNTNPVTQNICEHFFDYKLLSQQRVADFLYNGRKVFAHAPKDYFIKMMIKHL